MLDQEGLRGPTSCDWRTSNSNSCWQKTKQQATSASNTTRKSSQMMAICGGEEGSERVREGQQTLGSKEGGGKTRSEMVLRRSNE